VERKMKTAVFPRLETAVSLMVRARQAMWAMFVSPYRACGLIKQNGRRSA